MPTPTYTPLANITLGSSASSVTFSSISQAYRDLVLVVNGLSSGFDAYSIRFNADSGSNYTFVSAEGTGSATASATGTASYIQFPIGFNISSTTVPTNFIISIMDYSAIDKQKSVLIRANNSSNGTVMEAGRWASTSAITTIRVAQTTDTLAAGTTLALFGIAA